MKAKALAEAKALVAAKAKVLAEVKAEALKEAKAIHLEAIHAQKVAHPTPRNTTG